MTLALVLLVHSPTHWGLFFVAIVVVCINICFLPHRIEWLFFGFVFIISFGTTITAGKKTGFIWEEGREVRFHPNLFPLEGDLAGWEVRPHQRVFRVLILLKFEPKHIRYMSSFHPSRCGDRGISQPGQVELRREGCLFVLLLWPPGRLL